MPWPKGKKHSAATRERMRVARVGKTKDSPEGRFWGKVAKADGDACWLWLGSKNGDGYGNFFFGGKTDRAHRVAYALTVGPPGDLQVLHRCDNPACVRPSHLFLGTHSDNMKDAADKGRLNGNLGYRHSAQIRAKISVALSGKEKSARAKVAIRAVKREASPLDLEKVALMKQLRGLGWAFRALGRKFGVSAATAFNVCNGRTWS